MNLEQMSSEGIAEELKKLLQKIARRNDPGLSSIPTIIVTSARRADIRGTAVLRKPLDLAQLSETIRTLTGSGAQ